MTRPTLTNQQIFDRVATHLLTQNKKAVADSAGVWPTCRYLAADGTRCAVGCLFKTDAETNAIASCMAGTPSFIEYLAPGEVPRGVGLLKMYNAFDFAPVAENGPLLMALQNVHDDVQVKRWRAALRALARKFKLSDKVVVEFKR